MPKLLINDILEFSKISVKKELFREVDLNIIIDQILVDFEEQIEQKKIKVVVDKLPHLYVNPVLMNPLFSNLISNAIKYSRNFEGSYIRIRTDLPASKESHSELRGKKKYWFEFLSRTTELDLSKNMQRRFLICFGGCIRERNLMEQG